MRSNNLKCWVPYIREPGTSNKAIFEGDSKSADGKSVRYILAAANNFARGTRKELRVVLLSTKWDGLKHGEQVLDQALQHVAMLEIASHYGVANKQPRVWPN